MKSITEIIKIGFLFFIVACNGESSLNKEDYVHYVTNEDNGLLNTKEINDIEFHLQYEPINYKVLKKVKNRLITPKQYREDVERFKGGQYFIFKIALKDKQGDLLKYEAKNQEEYADRVQYFSSRMQNDFYLLDGKDSLKCNLFHFERTYGVSPFSTFVLGFDSNNELKEVGNTVKEIVKDDKVLVYDDKAFGVGPIKYKIRAKDINNIPELTIEYDVK
ncbi:MAG: hypothetical protein COB15_08720 [Flavobacteriales bacterium]|nr:MAG: hypothetical protein COB15_08720 [Flavobacteriales bacterium]